ncbi:MAG: T9SS type A sorting domain-containing protein [Salibacteraceae bacterium]
MLFNKAGLLVFFLLVFSFTVFSQEELGELKYRSSGEVTTNKTLNSSRADDTPIIYLYDLMDLPIIDDFSSYKKKVFVTDTSHSSVFDSLAHSFLADGVYLDSLEYSFDSVYNFIINPLTQQLDSSLAKKIKIDFYTDSLNPFTITNTEYVFPNYSTFTQNGNTRIIKYSPDSTLYNKTQVYYFAYDDDYSVWISEGAFWNRTMSIKPPTVGVITLDGLNESGRPYDNTDQYAYGEADVFSSKPINLYRDPNTNKRYTSSDNVYLSFFFQPYGNGDEPEEKDSLILDFYSPTNNRWYTVWSQEGIPNQEFKQVYIHLADTIYLQEGFQFRFRNYATLSGNFDHWHIDYIRLYKDRKEGDRISDFAFIEPIRTLLNTYTSMPWEHYKSNRYKYTSDKSVWSIRNLGPNPDLGASDYKIYINGNQNPFFKSRTEVIPTVPALDIYDVTHSINSSPNDFMFPSDTNERQLFIMKARSSSTQEQYEENDTLTHHQLFDRYYAYDDGSVEKTYQLNLVGTSVVVEFKSVIKDSLKAIELNFLETYVTPSTQQVNLLVYKDLDSPPIYQSGPVDVIRKASGNFYRYDISPIELEGTFYIGYQQLSEVKTYVGYDVNFNNQGRTFYKGIGGSWTNSTFRGTLMIRANFGNGDEIPLSNRTLEYPENSIGLYPNPSNGEVFFTEDIDEQVSVFNINGSILFDEHVYGNSINLNQLDKGFYFVRIGNKPALKLILTH